MHATHPLQTLIELVEQKQQRTTELSIRLGCDLNNLMQEMSPLDETFRQSLADVIGEWRTALENALLRSQTIGELRAEVDCARTALFVIAAVEGCVGTSKNQRSVDGHRDCLEGVKDYLRSLRA